jgi:hypothetical protein
MTAIGHFFINAIIAFAVTAAVFGAVNIAFYISGRGNPRAIKNLFDMRSIVRRMPPGTVFESKERRISALGYDRARDKDLVVPLYKAPALSLLSWSSGPRSAKAMYGRVNAELAIAAGALVLIALPLLIVGVSLAVSVSWLWWFAVIILAGAELVMMLTNKFFFLKWRAFSDGVPAILLHRYHVFSLSVAFIIMFVFVMISMAITVWAERSS